MHDSATLHNARYLSPSYPVRLKAYGNRRNVNVNPSLLDSSLRCWHFGRFTYTGDSSTIEGLEVTQDRRKGEYEGYRCHEILLMRLQWSSEHTSLGGSGNDRVSAVGASCSFQGQLNVYVCSSPTPALAKTWTLSIETSTGRTQISRFVRFKDANLSFRRLISPRFRQIHPSWYIQEHKTYCDRIQAEN